MHHIESTCPVCGKDTSGTLPFMLYGPRHQHRVYPCADHWKTMVDRQWKKRYFDPPCGYCGEPFSAHITVVHRCRGYKAPAFVPEKADADVYTLQHLEEGGTDDRK